MDEQLLWQFYSIFYLQAGACYPWGLDSSNHSWLEPRDTSWVLYKELVLSLSVGAEKICEDRDLPHHHSLLYWMVFINEHIIEFSIYIWCTLSTWLIYSYYALKINKCCVCYLRTSCKKLLGKVRKIGRSVHTLIHPPSQCGCCVLQKMGINYWKCTIKLPPSQPPTLATSLQVINKRSKASKSSTSKYHLYMQQTSMSKEHLQV